MSKLEFLFQPFEESMKDTKSVDKFYKKFVTTEEAEENFNTAIRDTRFNGFKVGFATAMSLFAEVIR